MPRRPRPYEERAETAASAARNRWRKRSTECQAYAHGVRRANMQAAPCVGSRSASGLERLAASLAPQHSVHHTSGSSVLFQPVPHIGCNTYRTPLGSCSSTAFHSKIRRWRQFRSGFLQASAVALQRGLCDGGRKEKLSRFGRRRFQPKRLSAAFYPGEDHEPLY